MTDNDITSLEKAILGAVFFTESFDHIIEESGEKPAIVGDCMKYMIHKKWIMPMRLDEQKGVYVNSFIYDTDNMSAYHYQITAKGLKIYNGDK